MGRGKGEEREGREEVTSIKEKNLTVFVQLIDSVRVSVDSVPYICHTLLLYAPAYSYVCRWYTLHTFLADIMVTTTGGMMWGTLFVPLAFTDVHVFTCFFPFQMISCLDSLLGVNKLKWTELGTCILREL